MRSIIVSSPGSAEIPNEDWAGATPTAAVVLDGVTVPPGMESGCHHGTPWYVNQLGTALLTALSAGTPTTGDLPELTMAAALRYAIAHTAFLHDRECDLGTPGAPTAAVAAVRVRGDVVEYLVLADVTILLALHGPDADMVKVTDDRVAPAMTGLHSGVPGVGTLIAERRAASRNVAGGYWVAAADPAAAGHAITGCLPAADVIQAVLLTDGAAALAGTYGTPWREMLYKPPAQILTDVRTIELGDPDCARWPRFKRSDDATVAVLGVG